MSKILLLLLLVHGTWCCDRKWDCAKCIQESCHFVISDHGATFCVKNGMTISNRIKVIKNEVVCSLTDSFKKSGNFITIKNIYCYMRIQMYFTILSFSPRSLGDAPPTPPKTNSVASMHEQSKQKGHHALNPLPSHPSPDITNKREEIPKTNLPAHSQPINHFPSEPTSSISSIRSETTFTPVNHHNGKLFVNL